jgi:hypothetical protein
MSKLAVLSKWAISLVEEVLAHLGLILLLEVVELTRVAIEAIVVGLLGKMSHDFAWWVVEVSLLTIWAELSFLELWFLLFASDVECNL